MRLPGAAWAALEYTDFIFYADMLDEERSKEWKRGLINQAFGAWLRGVGDKKSFEQFIDSLGLGEKKEKPKPEEQAAMIEKSNAIAERILKMVKRRPKVKNGKKNI